MVHLGHGVVIMGLMVVGHGCLIIRTGVDVVGHVTGITVVAGVVILVVIGLVVGHRTGEALGGHGSAGGQVIF